MDKTTMVLYLHYPEAGGDVDGMFILRDAPQDIGSKIDKWVREGKALYMADADGVSTDVESYLFNRIEEAGIKITYPLWKSVDIEF